MEQAEQLIRMGLHPSEIVAGYSKASKKVQAAIEGYFLRMLLFTLSLYCAEMVAFNIDDIRDADKVASVVRTVVGAKQHGHEDFLAPLIAKACVQIMPKNPKQFNVDNVRVAKIPGSGVHDSRVMKGFVLTRDTEGMSRVLFELLFIHVNRVLLQAPSSTPPPRLPYAAGLDLPKTETGHCAHQDRRSRELLKGRGGSLRGGTAVVCVCVSCM